MKNIIDETINNGKNLKIENNIENGNKMNITMTWIKCYECEKVGYVISEVQCQMLWYLIFNNFDIYEIRRKYKEILENTKRFDTNYYAHICILLNVMKNKYLSSNFDISKELNLSTFSYITKDMIGIMSVTLGHRSYCIQSYNSNVKYEYIEYPEGVGINEANIYNLSALQTNANNLLNQEKLNIAQAKKWIADYKHYIINVYGRWSKEYEEFMFIPFNIPFAPISPNILNRALRDTLKKGIINSLKICKE